MTAVLPRHVVCVLGRWTSFDAVKEIIREVGGAGFAFDEDYSTLERDPRMENAFEASRERVSPSFGKDDWHAVATHSAVAYVLSPPLERSRAQELSGRMLGLTAALLAGEGLAAKSESAGIAHGRARWLELAKKYAKGDALTRSATLSHVWVRRPLGDQDDGVLYSCGMHLLGERDVELASDLPVDEVIAWMDALRIYLLAEQPADGLRDGETFRPTDEDPRRLLRSTACGRYAEDDFFFNPYGYWRLVDAPGQRKSTTATSAAKAKNKPNPKKAKAKPNPKKAKAKAKPNPKKAKAKPNPKKAKAKPNPKKAKAKAKPNPKKAKAKRRAKTRNARR